MSDDTEPMSQSFYLFSTVPGHNLIYFSFSLFFVIMMHCKMGLGVISMPLLDVSGFCSLSSGKG